MSRHAATARISPTAYATGQLWFRHDLSHPALATPRGRLLGHGFDLLSGTTRLLGGVSLEAMLLARHLAIDAVLGQAIEDGRVSQVIEIAAGFSARGWRFCRRYGDRLTYLETDLPHMVRAKRQMLADGDLLTPRHRVVELDALAERGGQSLAAVSRTLDPDQGVAIITEGLMNYLAPQAAAGVWRRIARALKSFPSGIYLTDAYFLSENKNVGMLAFGAILQAFVRGRMHVHFKDPADAINTMQTAGFAETIVHRPYDLAGARRYAEQRGGDRVCIIEARR